MIGTDDNEAAAAACKLSPEQILHGPTEAPEKSGVAGSTNSPETEGEAEDVLVPMKETSYAVDLLGDALDTTSFENALVEIEEQSMHRHVCVWNAMDIRDSVARPGGISRTWLKPADSIDKVYGKTGTKFCPPIGLFGSNDDVDYIAWARDATVQDYPLLPLQNTVTESTGSKWFARAGHSHDKAIGCREAGERMKGFRRGPRLGTGFLSHEVICPQSPRRPRARCPAAARDHSGSRP